MQLLHACPLVSVLALLIFAGVVFAVDWKTFNDNSENKCGSLGFHNGMNHYEAMIAAIRASNWECAKTVVQHFQELDNVDFRGTFDIEQRQINKELQSLKATIESSLPMASITPAFQWAQSADEILLNVKFSHKIDAPATLNVEAQNVTLLDDRLILHASDGRKNFNLDLPLYRKIVPEDSSYDMASVGRMTFNLKKADAPRKWNKLTTKKVSQMHFWVDMHEKYSAQLDALSEDDDDRSSSKSKRKNASGKKGSKAGKMSAASITDDDDDASTMDVPKKGTTTVSPESKATKTFEKEIKAKIKSLESEAKTKKAEIDEKASGEKKDIEMSLFEETEKLRDTLREYKRGKKEEL
jgi:hypothetical protein